MPNIALLGDVEGGGGDGSNGISGCVTGLRGDLIQALRLSQLRNEDPRAFQNFMRPPAIFHEIEPRLTPGTKASRKCDKRRGVEKCQEEGTCMRDLSAN
ncbi:hypothetical protein DPMN_085293 [Dreissena polymorpha]|uniref:Uncharacterized protein n=1 Tax=Dreissena polymorpha TaxID=45954 RepID=A0A9D3YC48_DREPO|nr:hypothetical protein DPMN_085293 [Dreissena polymorpha]